MKFPLILVHETSGALARSLAPLAETRKWTLRERQRLEPCLAALGNAAAAVLVLKVGLDLTREMTLLQRVHESYPDVGVFVVSDADNSALAGLAWHLGASYVLVPPRSRELLPILVEEWLDAALRQPKPREVPNAVPLDPEAPGANAVDGAPGK